MKLQSNKFFKRTITIASILLLFSLATVAYATTHIVHFGGSFGNAYSPSSLNVSVGDTIQWQGNFSIHPLSSTSVPVGAQSFHQESSDVFSYPVVVEGTYQYQCDVHAGIGMTGSFTASITTSVEINQNSTQPNTFKLEQNFPNPFNPTTTISFNIPISTFVSIKVYNAIGQQVATIINEDMNAGSYTKKWNAVFMPSGVYFYRMVAGTFTETKRLIILK